MIPALMMISLRKGFAQQHLRPYHRLQPLHVSLHDVIMSKHHSQEVCDLQIGRKKGRERGDGGSENGERKLMCIGETRT